jgi:hypothetical protein
MVADVKRIRPSAAVTRKKVFIFASLHYWIEQTTITALGLAADNHDVTLGYYPYYDWFTDSTKFDLRRQNIYAKRYSVCF